jgi:hypothetical protein
LLMKEGHFWGPGLRVECCRRVGAGCRHRQSGKHVNNKAHRQPRVLAQDGAPRARLGDDGNPERRLNTAGRPSRQATAEDNGTNWHFDMGFSVS